MEFRVSENKIGKKTNGSNLNLPPESADILENFETVRDGIYRKPRGRNTYGTFASSYPNILNLLEYNDYLIASIGNTVGKELHWIDYVNSLIYQYTGTYTEPKTGFKIRNINLNKNCYLTTSDGMKVLNQINGSIIDSGCPKAIGFDAYLSDTTPVWLNGGQSTAYRVVWSRTDINTNVIVGAPSERIEITNGFASGTYKSVKLEVAIPAKVLTLYNTFGISCKLQVYRATQSVGVAPEDLQLCYEVVPAAADFAEEVYIFTDVTPDVFRGAALYTNTTQEGIAQSNYEAPLACCIDKYKNYLMLGNIQNLQRLNTNLVSTLNLINTSELKIYDSNSNIGGGVSGCVNAGGLVKITTTNAHGLSNGDYVFVEGITDATGANGTWQVTVVNGTSFTLQGSTFGGAYVNGGTVTNTVSVKFMRYDTNVGGTGTDQNDGIKTMLSNGGGGKVRVTTQYAHGLANGDYVQIIGVRAGSTVEANGCWQITYPTAGANPTVNDFDLTANFVHAFVPGSDATAGIITTADLSTKLAAIILVTNGMIKFTIDGVVYELTGLNFTSCTTWVQVVNVLQSALTNAVVLATTNGFSVASRKTGIQSTVVMSAATSNGTDLSTSTYFIAASVVTTYATGVDKIEGGHIDLIRNRGGLGTATGGITAIADNGSGKCRFSTASVHGLSVGDYVRLTSVTGTPLANGIFQVTATSAVNRFDINVAFVGTGTGVADLYEDLAQTPSGTGIRAFRHTTGTDSQNITLTSKSIIKAINLGYPNDIVQGFYQSGVSDTPGKILFEAYSLDQKPFYINANTLLTGGNFIPLIPLTGQNVISQNDDFQHAIMFSKSQEFEAFPLSNIQYIGNKGDPILGIMAMKDCVYIVKQKDGIYKLVGETINDFSINKFYDAECLQINSITKGQNSMFLMTSQGKLRISDTGVEQIGGDTFYEDMSVIENTNFQSGYGWFYDTENSYMLATHGNIGDTYNTIVSVYNGKQQNWWDWKTGEYTNDPNISCGIVIRNKCYTAVVDGLTVYEERKDFAVTDFCTPDIVNTISSIDTATNIVTFINGIVVPVQSTVVQGAFKKEVVEVIATDQLRLNNVLNLAPGLCTHKVPIISKIRFQQTTCGLPEYEKLFHSICSFFDSRETNITNITLRTSTDESKTTQDTMLVPLVANYWGQQWGQTWGTKRVTDRWLTEPPKEHTRGAYIYVEYEHRVPEEQCCINGYSLIYDATTSQFEVN